MTKAIEKKIEKYPLYSQDGKGEEAKVVCKFFNAFGDGTWYVLEGRKEENGDYLFFGIVEMYGEREYGYFTLSQLASARRWGMPCVERDLYFDAKTVSEIN